MNSRYERAGTIGFRCAADVPGSNATLECGGKALCGTFQAPEATVELPKSSADQWIIWGGAKSTRSNSGMDISEARSGSSGMVLTVCNGTQTTFSWAAGRSGLGSCLVNGSDGIVFNVSGAAGKTSTLSVYAGATASAAMIEATLMDG